jgi:hypothetical protein
MATLSARWRSLVPLSALIFFPVVAHCGAPFQTDDPNVVALGHVEVLGFYQGTLTATERSGSLPGFEFHFGIQENTELDITAPVAFNTPSGSATTRGYGDTLLGIKYRLVKQSETLPLVSFVPKVVIPTGDSARGLGNGGSQVALSVAAERQAQKLVSFANVAYWINNGSANRNYWFVGWEAQYQFSDHWIIGAEIFHTTSRVVNQPPSTGFNVGGYYVLDQHNQILFSGGRGIQKAAETNRVSAYLGYQLNF